MSSRAVVSNEMYGWDSYFIQVGLLRDGEIDLAKDSDRQFSYEIDKYGMILNAIGLLPDAFATAVFDRGLILGVYRQTHDKAWLAKTVPAIEKYYAVDDGSRI